MDCMRVSNVGGLSQFPVLLRISWVILGKSIGSASQKYLDIQLPLISIACDDLSLTTRFTRT